VKEVERTACLVKWLGSQGVFIAGGAPEVFSLDRFAGLKGLYAVGPLEDGHGEVSIFDGVPLISKVENGVVHVHENFRYSAGFLVYSTIQHWSSAAILRAGTNENDLCDQLTLLAVSHGLATDAPFPFLIQGRIERVTYHVLSNCTEGKYSPELHEKAKFRFEIAQEPVEIIGFYSRCHRGIFTPPDSDVHMHVRTLDNRLAGHVEKIRCGRFMTVHFPEW
jgi:acetolactate decarboxylase